MASFVWVEGMRGPTPEKWPEGYNNLDMQGQPRKRVLQSHALTEGEFERMTLDALVIVYPLEQKP